MDLTQEQINKISSIISISDIKEYINTHLKEYEELLKRDTAGF